jgi:hypothetical protein
MPVYNIRQILNIIHDPEHSGTIFPPISKPKTLGSWRLPAIFGAAVRPMTAQERLAHLGFTAEATESFVKAYRSAQITTNFLASETVSSVFSSKEASHRWYMQRCAEFLLKTLEKLSQERPEFFVAAGISEPVAATQRQLA